MAKAGKKTSTPEEWSPPTLVEIDKTTGAGIHEITRELFVGAGNLGDVPTNWFHLVNLDILPKRAAEWLKIRADSLRASPDDSGRRISDISGQFEREMNGALRRGQCDGAWTAKSIENMLIKQEWWPRTTRVRRP
jgi:hypothetical protein